MTYIIGQYITENEENLSKLPSKDAYQRKYKPIFLISKIATNLVGAKLVNFTMLSSTFKEHDSDKFYEVLFTLIMITPIEEISSYIKVTIEVMTDTNIFGIDFAINLHFLGNSIKKLCLFLCSIPCSNLC